MSDTEPSSTILASMEITKGKVVRDPDTNILHGLDELAQFFAANPNTFDALKSLVLEETRKASSEQDAQLLADEKHARDTHSKLLKLIVDSKLDFSDSSNVPESTVADARRIVQAQYEVPMDLPLPLLWPADQDSSTSTAMTRAAPRHPAMDADDSSSSDDTSHEGSRTDDLVHRLAVSMDPDFTYAPELFKMTPVTSRAAPDAAGPSATTLPGPQFWSYRALYRLEYPEATTAADVCEKLAEKGLKLPQVVLDLGRLLVTSDQEDRSDGSSWSPSDFTVMVDVESKGRPVWVVCDSHVVSDLRFLNYRDGMADDLNLVRSLFDRHAMDLALLFPSIEDWATPENTWPALHDRITKTGMKLGLRLRHL